MVNIDKIPRLTLDEQVFSAESGDNKKLKVLRQEPESVAVMQYLGDRISNAGDLVFDPFQDFIGLHVR